MAMGFREPNMARWLGVRPAHNGTQVAKYASAINTTAIVYTVTAGKVLHLFHAEVWIAVAAAGQGFLLVRNAADVAQYYFLPILCAAAVMHPCGVANFYPPVEIPEGWDICVVSSAAVLSVTGEIFAWEEDA